MCSKIAAIVLNYNDYNETIECVKSILKQTKEYAIVIVDNNSSNNSFEILIGEFGNDNNVYVVRNNENKGYAAGNNVGFHFAIENIKELEYLVVMNPDTRFADKDLLNTLAQKLSKYDDAAVIAPVMVQHGKWDIKRTYWDTPTTWDIFRRQFIWCKKRNQADLVIHSDNTAYVGAVSGSFFMIKKKALEDIGFLDEGTFLYGEENLLSLDLRRHNYRELLDVSQVFNHNHKKNSGRHPLSKKISSAKISSDSRIYVVKKHYSRALVPIMVAIYYMNIVVISTKHSLGVLRSLIWGKK